MTTAIVIGTVLLLTTSVYLKHHSLPSRLTARERLIMRNPMLSAADLRWPDEQTIRTALDRVRAFAGPLLISLALTAGVTVDRRNEVYVPAWYDR